MKDYPRVLRDLADQHLLRELRTSDVRGSSVEIDGHRLIALASNDYLGLSRHPTLIEAAVEATRRFGVGAGAARLLSGTRLPHTELEAALARFKQTDASLVFGSGYLTNIGVIPALIGRGGLILMDRLCHASLWDGCRLSGADVRMFEHNDVTDLDRLLRERRSGRAALIVTEGVFSMDGDLSPLPDLLTVAERYDAMVLVDDAHGTAVMGASGRGTPEHFGVEKRMWFQMGTLGKALGTSGGYIAGEAAFVSVLVNTARSFIYATAPPPATAAAACAALSVVQREPERRVRLWANRTRLMTGIQERGFRTTATETPIIPILIGDAERALALARRLTELGIYAPAIRPPTVPEGASRLRLTVTSDHSEQEIDTVVAALDMAGRELRIL
ncbi:MAG TPA: 8-amino-7-oxononanoate synthase [Nitrospirales bacterium]|nr:8-amino-7-oxononanoate synthase [Nitrospirales bacterium]